LGANNRPSNPPTAIPEAKAINTLLLFFMIKKFMVNKIYYKAKVVAITIIGYD
jgi:hypothetical protein